MVLNEARQNLIRKVADELYLEHAYVEEILTQLEEENLDLQYGHATLAELVARVLDSLGSEKENW